MPESLIDLLTAYRPADTVEEEHRQALLDLLACPSDPFDRTRYTPGHVTAGGFVVSPGGDVLLVHHRRLRIWVQPGGHVDPEDASVLAAARREVTEETGVASLDLVVPGIFDVDVHRVPARGDEPAHQHFDVRFAFAASDPVLQASPEVAAARWVSGDELEEITTDASVRRAVAKLRHLRLPIL